jgi:hypothetical protein
MQSGTLPTIFPPQIFCMMSAHSSAMECAFLQSPLDAHVANWFAQVRNSYIQHIAQSTEPSGHTVITTSAIASVDSSAKCILSILEKAVGKTAPDADGVAHDVVADITLDLGPEVIVRDFAVVYSGASLYMEHPIESRLNQDGEAKDMERSKNSKYANIAPSSTPPPASVSPFVIEASGRLGPAAINFLLRICPTRTFVRTHFLNEVSLICALTLGKS